MKRISKSPSKKIVAPPSTQRLSLRNHHRSVLEVVTTTTKGATKNSIIATLPPESSDDDDDDDTPLTELVAKRKEISERTITIASSDESSTSTSEKDSPKRKTVSEKHAGNRSAATSSKTTTKTMTTIPDTSRSNRRRNTPARTVSAVKESSRVIRLDDDVDSSTELPTTKAKKETRSGTLLTQQTPNHKQSRKKEMSAKRRAVYDSDDEEYQEENDVPSDDDDDDSVFEPTSDASFVGDVLDYNGDSEEISINKGTKSIAGAKVGIVNEGDIGEQEIDDDDSVVVVPTPFSSPRLEMIEPRLHHPMPQNNDTDDDDDDDSSRSSDTKNEDGNDNNSSQKRTSAKKVQKCIRCDSRKDAVTADDLPPLHICFFPPDNQNKQCFALETLRKIALAQPNSRSLVSTNGTIERARTQFLQPPHFRTPMSDDLLDQIASRFGRAATDIHGDYYRRRHENPDPNEAVDADERQRPIGSSLRLAQSESIIDQLDRYMRQRLGNQDIYCCPICYVVAHQRLATTEDAIRVNDDDDDDSDVRDEYITDFSYDPMTVLSDIGTCGEPFQVASTFCYKKLSQLKEHLRQDHNVDTKIVDGNDFYNRFKVRAQDGLLQRFLTKNSGQFAPTRQGAMLQYWIYGNSSDFVLLLSLISHAILCRDIVRQSDAASDHDPAAAENAEQYLLPSFAFFDSFAKEARSIWNTITSPFLKASNEEIRDFIADDEYDIDEMEDAEPILSHRALHMQAELEVMERERYADERLAARYQQEVRKSRNDGELPDQESDDYVESDAEVYTVNDDSPVSESESDSDEWQKSILTKRDSKVKSSTPQKRAGRRVSMSSMKVSPKKRFNASVIRSNDDENDSPLITASSSVVVRTPSNRLAIQDSDDE